MIVGTVDGDTVKPCGQGRPAVELLGPPQCLDASILCHLLGHVHVADDPQRHAVHPRHMAGYFRGKRVHHAVIPASGYPVRRSSERMISRTRYYSVWAGCCRPWSPCFGGWWRGWWQEMLISLQFSPHYTPPAGCSKHPNDADDGPPAKGASLCWRYTRSASAEAADCASSTVGKLAPSVDQASSISFNLRRSQSSVMGPRKSP